MRPAKPVSDLFDDKIVVSIGSQLISKPIIFHAKIKSRLFYSVGFYFPGEYISFEKPRFVSRDFTPELSANLPLMHRVKKFFSKLKNKIKICKALTGMKKIAFCGGVVKDKLPFFGI